MNQIKIILGWFESSQFWAQARFVCVWGGGGGGPVRTDISGQFCVFNRISADTCAVGTSPVVKPMPINVLSIFKHIDIVNVFFYRFAPTQSVKARFVYRG